MGAIKVVKPLLFETAAKLLGRKKEDIKGCGIVYLIAYVYIGWVVRTIWPKRRDVNE